MSQDPQNPAGAEQPLPAAQVPQAEPEPEGGPLRRARAFLEERLARLQPREAGLESLEAQQEAISLQETLSYVTGESAEGAELPQARPGADRREIVEQYRQRQRARMRFLDVEGLAPPEPPLPPPANNWVPIGPSVLRRGQGGTQPPTSGRTPAIAVAPGGRRVYIGAANGGVWRSDDEGQTWRSLMDAFDLNPTHQASDSLSVGAIAIDLANPERVYVGSGEGAGGAYFGVGPIVSPDGGQNWITEPVAPGSPPLAGSAFYALAVDPVDPERVVAATRRGLYRREPDGQGGFHWAEKSLGDEFRWVWVTSAVVARSGERTAYYAVPSGGPVFTSPDGHTWSVVGSGFPSGVGRISLAVKPDQPRVIYALTSLGSVYRLDLADGAWRQIGGAPPNLVGTQGWYDLAIAVAPDNVNRIYLGGSLVFSGGDWSGSVYRAEVHVSGTTVSMVPTYIGNSVHADIHALVFAPGDPQKLWLGCDGGVYFSNNPLGSGDIFQSRNAGLTTLTMNYLAQHPVEDAVLFCGTQDNGGVRYTGEEAWLYSSGGDGGFAVVNWRDPYQVLSTYVLGSVRKSMDGGSRYSYFNVDVPLARNALGQLAESVLFYAPLAGTPPDWEDPAAADVVAFGSIRPWISTAFGDDWRSIPTGTLDGDRLDTEIKSLVFASRNRLYAGTMWGRVYRFDRADGGWTRTQIDDLGAEGSLPIYGPVTDIVVDPADPSGSAVYITLGGSGDYRHVWHFDGSRWEARSGPAAGDLNSLLDVQANALAADPANPAHLYLGADIGVWRSVDGGRNWAPFSEGLPDASVLDLRLHPGRRLLRAATHGRGVFERSLEDRPRSGVELYVRTTQLDTGRSPAVDGLPNPCALGELVWHWRAPDIKLDAPDAAGQYQIPSGKAVGFLEFCDTLSEDFLGTSNQTSAGQTTRVYVQLHNRGVVPADQVRVTLLAANLSAALPPLPPGYEVQIQNGLGIDSPHWQTVGVAMLDDLRAGAPKVAAFDLTAAKLPPPANQAGRNQPSLLALVHHARDPYVNGETRTDVLVRNEPKAALKAFTSVQFSGPDSASQPAFIPVRLHNADPERDLKTTLLLQLGGYSGPARLYVPGLDLDVPLEDAAHGLRVGDEMGDFLQWAQEQQAGLAGSQDYHPAWVDQRLADIRQVIDAGAVLEVEDSFQSRLDGIRIPPGGYRTVFLALDRPPEAGPGWYYPFQVYQWDDERQEVIGGFWARAEVVIEPVAAVLNLQLKSLGLHAGYRVVARLSDASGNPLSPDRAAEVSLAVATGPGPLKELGTLRWHRRWQAYYTYLRVPKLTHMTVRATARLNGETIAEASQVSV